MTHFVYILECSDKSLYTGCTCNIERRINEHNGSKKGAHYTKIRRPVVLKYYKEFETLAGARRREAEIKRLDVNQKRKLCNVCYNISSIKNHPSAHH